MKKTIKPLSLNDCLDFIFSNMDDISMGYYEFKIDCGWIGSFPSEVLEVLALHSDEKGKISIAEKTNKSDVLKILAKDENEMVRSMAAGNVFLENAVAKILLNDPSETVRFGLAANPNLDPDLLLLLSREGDELIRNNVAANPNTPISVLRIFSKNWDTVFGVVRNPKIQPSFLEEMVSSKEFGYFCEKYKSFRPGIENRLNDLLESIVDNPNVSMLCLKKIKKLKSQYKFNFYGTLGSKLNDKLREKGVGKYNKQVCFIATAVLDEKEDFKELFFLRNFRDDFLLNSNGGIFFFRCYCLISPPIAKAMVKIGVRRLFWRRALLFFLGKFKFLSNKMGL